jgi:hypothetical protein
VYLDWKGVEIRLTHFVRFRREVTESELELLLKAGVGIVLKRNNTSFELSLVVRMTLHDDSIKCTLFIIQVKNVAASISKPGALRLRCLADSASTYPGLFG